MILNLLLIRSVAFAVLAASFSLPCWSQEQKSPTAVASPEAEPIGLVNQVAYLLREVRKLEQKVQVDVPLGTMLPYFGVDLPEGGNWVWADGKTNWPDLHWVPVNLRGRPVPDMSNGLLVSGPRGNVQNGEIWKSGHITVPQLEVDGKGLQVPSLKGVWPLSGFGDVFGPLDNDPIQGGQFYAIPEFRDVVFVKMLSSLSLPLTRKWVRDHGIGVANAYVSFHPNTSQVRVDDYTEVALKLDFVARAGTNLSGTAFTKEANVQPLTSDASPPAIACGWIIRIR